MRGTYEKRRVIKIRFGIDVFMYWSITSTTAMRNVVVYLAIFVVYLAKPIFALQQFLSSIYVVYLAKPNN